MTAPAFVAAGTPNSGTTGSVTYAHPAGLVDGDVEIAALESAATAGVVTPAAWVDVAGSPRAQGSNTLAVNALLHRYASGDIALVGAASGNHQTGVVVAFRGCASGDPVDTTSNTSGNSAAPTGLGVTTTVADCRVVWIAVWGADDATPQYSNVANSSLSGIIVHAQSGTTNGNGGGVLVASGVKTTAGAVAAWSADLAVSQTWASIVLVLKPALDSTPVEQTFATSWAVASPLEQTFPTGWAVRAAVGVATATSWAVRGAAASTYATTWAVRQGVAATRAASWSVRALASRTAGTSWAVRAPAARTFPTSWNVTAPAGQVEQTFTTGWAVRQAVAAARSTSWSTRAQVIATTATSWSVRRPVALTAGMSWAVRVVVTVTRPTSWAVRAVVGRVFPTGWKTQAHAAPVDVTVVSFGLKPRAASASLRRRAVAVTLRARDVEAGVRHQ